jgi:hypothetical protein
MFGGGAGAGRERTPRKRAGGIMNSYPYAMSTSARVQKQCRSCSTIFALSNAACEHTEHILSSTVPSHLTHQHTLAHCPLTPIPGSPHRCHGLATLKRRHTLATHPFSTCQQRLQGACCAALCDRLSKPTRHMICLSWTLLSALFSI